MNMSTLPTLQSLPHIDVGRRTRLYAQMNGILHLVQRYDLVHGDNSWERLSNKCKRPLTLRYRQKVRAWEACNPSRELPDETAREFARLVVPAAPSSTHATTDVRFTCVASH